MFFGDEKASADLISKRQMSICVFKLHLDFTDSTIRLDPVIGNHCSKVRFAEQTLVNEGSWFFVVIHFIPS